MLGGEQVVKFSREINLYRGARGGLFERSGLQARRLESGFQSLFRGDVRIVERGAVRREAQGVTLCGDLPLFDEPRNYGPKDFRLEVAGDSLADFLAAQ